MANRCNCPTPPGGVVICEGNQMALCIIQDGQAIQRCINPPQNRYYREYSALEIVNWAIEKITNEKRILTEEVEQSYLDMLKGGAYEVYNYRVTFSLPPKILRALDDLDNGLSNNVDNNNDLLIS